jgi:hypothetical protein
MAIVIFVGFGCLGEKEMESGVDVDVNGAPPI